MELVVKRNTHQMELIKRNTHQMRTQQKEFIKKEHSSKGNGTPSKRNTHEKEHSTHQKGTLTTTSFSCLYMLRSLKRNTHHHQNEIGRLQRNETH